MVAAIALGSNLESEWGDRETNLRVAVERLGELGTVMAVSRFHDTEPVGMVEQPRFLNGAALLETELEPVALMRGLLGIEQGMGRDRTAVAAKPGMPGPYAECGSDATETPERNAMVAKL